MDYRRDRVTLDKLQFRLVPKKFGIDFEKLFAEDPELPHMERTYATCYLTVFNKQPPDRASRFKNKILAGMRQANCSLRLFLLTCMIGHQRNQEFLCQRDPNAKFIDFHAEMLSDKTAIERAKTYGDLCRRSFGTFSLSSLDTLLEDNIEENDYSVRMLNSEIIAGTFIVGDKIFHDGDPWDRLYAAKELHLDEVWLAIEDTYIEIVLETRSKGGGTPKLSYKKHRQSVVQAHGFLKKYRRYAVAAFQAREKIMPEAVERVVNYFGYQPEDFELPNNPVSDPMMFWLYLGRAVSHAECLRYLEGQPSRYDTLLKR